MTTFDVPPIYPNSPWAALERPNIKWCEEILISLIAAPANTWSNLAYIISGVYNFLLVRNERGRLIKLFGPVIIFLGCASFIYHAFYTLFFQFFDLVGMLMFIFLPLTFIFI